MRCLVLLCTHLEQWFHVPILLWNWGSPAHSGCYNALLCSAAVMQALMHDDLDEDFDSDPFQRQRVKDPRAEAVRGAGRACLPCNARVS